MRTGAESGRATSFTSAEDRRAFVDTNVRVYYAHDAEAGQRLEQAQISFWDAMVVRSAAALGCDLLYTEDLNAGQRYDGVLIVEPFA